MSGRSLVGGVLIALVVIGAVACRAEPAPAASLLASGRPASATTSRTSQPGHSVTAHRTVTPARAVAPTGPTESATVVRVVDGDTIIARIAGQEYRVRYIGIDAPESVKPDTTPQPYGKAASRANESLVGGREVILEKDVSEVDRYGRLLRYVWVEDAGGLLLVNLDLVQQGFAYAATFPPDVKYVELFTEAQAQARLNGIGVWSGPPAR